MRKPAIAREIAGHFARWRGALVLNYHRIGDGSRSIFDRGLWSATVDGFDAQVRWLKANFDVISPRDLPYVVRVKRGRHVVLTFDDGYADNHANALPVLRAHGVHASFFITTGFIDDPRLSWWDEIAWMVRTSTKPSLAIPEGETVTLDEPERVKQVDAALNTYKRLGPELTTTFLDRLGEAAGTGRATKDAIDPRRIWMTWDSIRALHAAKMTIGGHTVRHPILSSLSREEQQREIDECIRRIEAEVGINVRAFAYPVGGRTTFNQDTRAALKNAGILQAFSYYGGIGKLDAWDEFDIPRVPIEQHHTFADFRAIVMFPWVT